MEASAQKLSGPRPPTHILHTTSAAALILSTSRPTPTQDKSNAKSVPQPPKTLRDASQAHVLGTEISKDDDEEAQPPGGVVASSSKNPADLWPRPEDPVASLRERLRIATDSIQRVSTGAM